MGRVLAIEPEASKAEALRQLVRNDVGAEFVLVTSAYAAVVAINRQLPDLVLFSESISDRHRERVVDHLKSVSRTGGTPTLSIPALRNGDRAAFVSQIGTSLGQRANAKQAAPAKAPSSGRPHQSNPLRFRRPPPHPSLNLRRRRRSTRSNSSCCLKPRRSKPSRLTTRPTILTGPLSAPARSRFRPDRGRRRRRPAGVGRFDAR